MTPTLTPTAALLLPGEPPATAHELARAVATSCYTTIDTASPTARLRGTSARTTPDGGRELIGWQRNVARVHKMDVVLPTVLRVRLDADDRVTAAGLEPTFAGSRGVLCYHPYADGRVRSRLIGRHFDDDLAAEVSASAFACFHVAEVLSDLIGADQVRRSAGLPAFFEQECLDAVQTGDALTMFGHQQVRGQGSATYRVVIENVFTAIRFDPVGAIFSTAPLTVRTFLGEELVAERRVSGATAGEFFLSIQRATRPLLRRVGQEFAHTGTAFACSNLAPRSFVGAFVQAIAGKLYADNYTYILHCLSGLQRQGGRPRCMGGVLSQAEANEHFPGFDITAAVCG